MLWQWNESITERPSVLAKCSAHILVYLYFILCHYFCHYFYGIIIILFKKFYLCIYFYYFSGGLWRVLVAVRRLFVAACEFSLSSCGAWAPEHVGSVVCSTWALSLRCAGSVVVERGLSSVVRRLSCSAACGTLVPNQGSNLRPLRWQADFTIGPAGKPLLWYYKDWL